MGDYRSIRIALVRHAQARASDGSYDEHTPLSALGQRQAQCVAQAFRGRGAPQAIYASPFPRCVETAAPLCDALRVSPQLDRRLCEFEMQAAPLSAVEQRADLVIWESTHRGKAGGETLAEFSRRVASCLQDIADQHLGSDVVVFTHSGVIDAAFRWFVGLAHESSWTHDLPTSNASITELEYWPMGRALGGSPRYTAVLRVCDTSHLTDCWSDF
jgi:probable phosphoglycerate mutase